MLSKPIIQIINKYNFSYDEVSSKVTGSFILPKHPEYTLCFEFTDISSDESLAEALSYELSAFSFEKIENVYAAEGIDLDISAFSEDFKELYKLLCHVTNEIDSHMKGAEFGE